MGHGERREPALPNSPEESKALPRAFLPCVSGKEERMSRKFKGGRKRGRGNRKKGRKKEKSQDFPFTPEATKEFTGESENPMALVPSQRNAPVYSHHPSLDFQLKTLLTFTNLSDCG